MPDRSIAFVLMDIVDPKIVEGMEYLLKASSNLMNVEGGTNEP